jgi:dihydroorotase
MNILLQHVTIIDPLSPHHNQQTDILIENGVIRQIGKYLAPEGLEVVQGNNLHVSPGWMDLHAHVCDPGFEHRETLESAAAAAAKGGFTAVLAQPDTQPFIQTKSTVEYMLRRSQALSVDLYPAGALTLNLEGKEMAELYDMHLAGAKGFSNGEHAVHHAGVLVRSLMYAANFGGRVHVRCDDKNISQGGYMHEGPMSTALGMKGIPALAEELAVARNLYLAEYAQAPIHFMAISATRSVQLIREAKAKGLAVTAAVHAANLFWNDSVLEGFDTNFKTDPPLRGEKDRLALIEGIKDGTIDCITSGHTPEDSESKVVEFDLAYPGMIGLESAYALVNTLGQFSPEEIVNALCHQPRRIAQVAIPIIKTGEKANITIFDTSVQWTFTDKDICSKSKNTSLPGTALTGKVIGIFNKGKLN